MEEGKKKKVEVEISVTLLHAGVTSSVHEIRSAQPVLYTCFAISQLKLTLQLIILNGGFGKF